MFFLLLQIQWFKLGYHVICSITCICSVLHVLFEIVPSLQCTLFLHCKFLGSNHDITSALNWFCFAMYLLSEIVPIHFAFITHFLHSDGNFAEQCCFRAPFLLVFDHCCNYNILAAHSSKAWSYQEVTECKCSLNKNGRKERKQKNKNKNLFVIGHWTIL